MTDDDLRSVTFEAEQARQLLAGRAALAAMEREVARVRWLNRCVSSIAPILAAAYVAEALVLGRPFDWVCAACWVYIAARSLWGDRTRKG